MRKDTLEKAIELEEKRPRPDSLALSGMKREKLQVKQALLAAGFAAHGKQ